MCHSSPQTDAHNGSACTDVSDAKCMYYDSTKRRCTHTIVTIIYFASVAWQRVVPVTLYHVTQDKTVAGKRRGLSPPVAQLTGHEYTALAGDL